MQLLRLGPPGEERPAVRADSGVVFALDPITADVDGRFLERGGIERARAALAAGDLPVLEGADRLRIGPPVARPTALVCIGQNYAAHAAESGSAPPEQPIVFFKHPSSLVGANDDVRIPPGAQQVDWEVELVAVIGRRCDHIESPEQALGHVAGYTIGNDVSERRYQRIDSGGQWSKGKSCATFAPVGPAIAPADEVGDPQALRLRSWVNGEARQDSTTADMIFGVAHLVHHLSRYMVLEPGDLLFTGTPEGVAMSGRFPYLQPGDVVRMEIDGLGAQEQRLVG